MLARRDKGRKCESTAVESAQGDEISKQGRRPGADMDGEKVMKDVLIKEKRETINN